MARLSRFLSGGKRNKVTTTTNPRRITHTTVPPEFPGGVLKNGLKKKKKKKSEFRQRLGETIRRFKSNIKEGRVIKNMKEITRKRHEKMDLERMGK